MITVEHFFSTPPDVVPAYTAHMSAPTVMHILSFTINAGPLNIFFSFTFVKCVNASSDPVG